MPTFVCALCQLFLAFICYFLCCWCRLKVAQEDLKGQQASCKATEQDYKRDSGALDTVRKQCAKMKVSGVCCRHLLLVDYCV